MDLSNILGNVPETYNDTRADDRRVALLGGGPFPTDAVAHYDACKISGVWKPWRSSGASQTPENEATATHPVLQRAATASGVHDFAGGGRYVSSLEDARSGRDALAATLGVNSDGRQAKGMQARILDSGYTLHNPDAHVGGVRSGRAPSEHFD